MKVPEKFHNHSLADSNPEELITEAFEVGVETANELLLSQCYVVAADRCSSETKAIEKAASQARQLCDAGLQLRWFDFQLGNDHGKDSRSAHVDTLRKTLEWSHRLYEGAICMIYIEVPAYNDLQELEQFFGRLKEIDDELPLAVVVADNNSTDSTAKFVSKVGGNVVSAAIQGIGPARQAARDTILRCTPVSLDQTIIIQTDADCLMSPGYISAVHDAFRDNAATLLTFGPTWYTVNSSSPSESNKGVILTNGPEYRDFTGAKTLQEYFQTYGREIGDYLLGERHPIFIGPNTAYRASLFDKYSIRYPEDKRWEQLYLTIELQRQSDIEEIATFVNEQHMHASARGIVHLLKEKPSAQGVAVYSDPNPAWTAASTVEVAIREMDQKTYELTATQQVEAVVAESATQAILDTCNAHASHEVRPARHAATGAQIDDKVAIIGVNAVTS